MRLKINDRIVCADGASVSVQAGRCMYCTPRNDNGPYTHVEAGYPSVQPPASWMKYIDSDHDAPCATVYGYIPTALVREFIDAHGGMVDGELPVFFDAVDPHAADTGTLTTRDTSSTDRSGTRQEDPMREQRLSAREHISEGERLMLIGLLTLAKSHNKALRDIEAAHNKALRNIEAAAYSITREVDREGALVDGMGHTSDALFCDYEVDDLLRRLGLTVQAQGDPAPEQER